MHDAPQLLCQHAIVPAGEEWDSPKGAWLFLLAGSGAGYLFNCPGIVELALGAAAVFPPAKAATVRASQLTALRLDWFVVDISQLFGLLTLPERRWLQLGYGIDTAPNPLVVGAEDPVAKTFRQVCDPSLDGSPAMTQRANALIVLANYLGRFVPGPSVNGHPYVNSTIRLERILSRLTESEFLALSADDLAERCRCDRRRVLQLFRQCLGVSLRRQQGNLRKLRASQLLNQGASIQEVASECGYENTETFRVWFRRAFGTGLSRWLDVEHESAEPNGSPVE